jgi:mannosyltransferase
VGEPKLRLTSTWRPSPTQVVLGLTVLGAALRFGTLNVQSIWLDESATLILVHRGLSGMLSHLSSSESTPPLYYILVWGWSKVFGAGPIGFRSFSALVGTLTIPAMYAAGREVSPRVGMWAAALAVVNPAMYYYSQEARAYALLILFSAVAFALWQRALRMPDRRRLALWAGASMLALLTHYFAAFLFLPEAVILVRRVGWRRVWAPIGAVALTGAALLPLAAAQRGDGKVNWIEESSLGNRIGETLKQFLVGLYGPAEILTAVLAALLAAGAILLVARRGDEHERASARDAAIVAAAGLAVPVALAFSHALDIFDGRNVIATWVPCAVLVAIGLGARRAGRAGVALGVGLCAVSLAVIVATNALPAYQRDDWRGVARALAATSGARVIVGEQFAAFPLSVYLDRVRGVSGAGVATRELDFVALRTRRTGRAPDPAVVPTHAPPGFRLAEVRRGEAFAVSRFVAPAATPVRVRALRRIAEDPKAEVFTQG